MIPVNATGWEQVISGNATGLITGVFTMYNTALLGAFVGILFFIYQFMLYMKSRSAVLCFTTGIIFAGMYLGSFIITPWSTRLIILLLVFELGGILFTLVWK